MKRLNGLSTLTSKAGKSWENNPRALTLPGSFQYVLFLFTVSIYYFFIVYRIDSVRGIMFPVLSGKIEILENRNCCAAES